MFGDKKLKVIKLDYEVEVDHIPTIKSAKLVYINGKNALSTRVHAISDDHVYTYLQMCLNNIPIIQINDTVCPTCSKLLATGYGIEKADCQELIEIRNRINEPFVSLDKSIEDMTPLLTLLESGLYIIADAICYPTDGNGNFFWNVPNHMTENPATAGVLLTDRDYEYVSGQPIYLYPTQDTDCYNEMRVQHYMKQFEKTEEQPRAIVYNRAEFVSFILDGHHKACAAALLKKPLKCLVIIPFYGISYEAVGGIYKSDEIFNSVIRIPVKAIPKKYVPSEKTISKKPTIFKKSKGSIVHRDWEDVYLKSVDSYPTLIEYAEAVSVGITYEDEITDELIEECLIRANEEACWKLKSILFMMQLKGDIRLKQTSIECIKRIYNQELVIYAYRILNKIKNDPEIEQLFIDYLVACDDRHDMIRIIVNSYWDE